MKKIIALLFILLYSVSSQATIHQIQVWDGYYQFLPANLTIQLGDTIHWTPLDAPSMVHTVTSANIPAGATPFDQIWQLPADTFFQYIPLVAGNYEYVCTPHVDSWGMQGTFFVDGGQATDLEAEEEFIVFPSPASSQVAIRGWEEMQDYQIFDASGKLVSVGTSDRIIDTSVLASGMYFLKWQGLKPQALRFLKE